MMPQAQAAADAVCGGEPASRGQRVEIATWCHAGLAPVDWPFILGDSRVADPPPGGECGDADPLPVRTLPASPDLSPVGATRDAHDHVVSRHHDGIAGHPQSVVHRLVPVGKELMKLASHGMKRTTMELGGHAPVLVFEDVDLDSVLDQCVAAKRAASVSDVQ